MSFEVTATKKRPQNFDELVGQDFVVATLKSSLERERIAHAYLFSGPRGVGKTSAARILAKSLNCENGPAVKPCDTCVTCGEISRGNSLDVIEIDGASNTGVNDIREIKDEVLFAPNSSRYKIYIIDEVHMLSNSAFNALLKTIEEPPPYIVFIFATTEIHKVPATIRSRCQQYNFRLIALDEIKRLLRETCDENDVKAEDDALFWIAKEATGSLRDAYTLYDQVVSFSQDEITLKKIQEKLGLMGIDRISTIVRFLSAEDRKQVLQTASDIIESGVSVEQFIIDLTEYFRNILLIKHGIKKESLLGYALIHFDDEVVDAFSPFQLERIIAMLLELYRNIRYSLNQKFELELVLSKIASFGSFITQEELLEKIKSLKSQVYKHGAPAGSAPETVRAEQGTEDEALREVEEQRPVEKPSEVEEEEEVSIPGELDEDTIERIISGLKKKLALSTALENAISWTLKDDTIMLLFDSSYAANTVKQDLQSVTETAQEVLQKKITVIIEIRRPEKEDERHHDEQVEMVKRVFRGEIIKE